MNLTRLPLDRMISLYAVRPFKRLLGEGESGTLSLLMYHSISEDKEGFVHPYYRLCTPPGLFERHLGLLKKKGYALLDLETAVKQLTEGTLQGRNAVITFDDGFMDFYENAFPILMAHGAPATVFLPVNFIADRCVRLNGREHMTWHEASEMAAAGIRFGSHTLSHRRLALLSRQEIWNEVARSKEIIENRLAVPARTFSFPYSFPETNGELIAFVRQCLEESRYLCGVTTMIGNASNAQDRFFLRRLPVNSADDEALFSAKLQGYYDWLHGVQYAYKKTTEAVFS